MPSVNPGKTKCNTPLDGNRQGWKQDPIAVRRDILRTATTEFAAHGLSGARMDEIAAKTKTSKRMIYYYFGDKNGLYRDVLEGAYQQVRDGEDQLALAELTPTDALIRLIEFTFDYHRRHPEFIRLVMIENINDANSLKQSDHITQLNRSAIDTLERICQRGIKTNEFRADVIALDLHWHISALCFFNVSNQATFSLIFGKKLFQEPNQKRLRQQAVEMILPLATR